MGSIRNLPLLGASYNFKLLLWGAVPKKTWNWQFSRWIPMGSSDKKRRLSFCKLCAEWLLIQTHTFHRQHCPGCMKSQRANVLIEIYKPFDDQASTGTSWKAFSATSRAASHCISPWDHKLAARQYFWRDAYFILKSYSCLAGSLSPSNLIRLGALRMEFMTKRRQRQTQRIRCTMSGKGKICKTHSRKKCLHHIIGLQRVWHATLNY